MTRHETRMLIDGELIGAADGGTYVNENPATAEPVGDAADATEGDVDRALTAARRAFDTTEWRSDLDLRLHALGQLAAALEDATDELTETTIAEVGAPRSACATVQVGEPLRFVPYYREVARHYGWTTDLGPADTLGGPAHRWTEAVPAGVVAAITPWNVPTQINLAKIVPALAAGCAVVLKPAVETPFSACLLGRLIAERTDIPPGVVNVVTAVDPAAGALLTADPRVDMISFTGSTATGQKVMQAASAHLTRVFLELGGKSAMVALDDVDDLGSALFAAVFGMALVAGQGCALSTRVIVPRHRYEESADAIVSLLETLVVGDPQDPATTMGPLIGRRQRDRVDGFVRRAVDEGARVAAGGRVPEGPGWFYAPTLVTDVEAPMEIAREEVFGPVLSLMAHDGDDHAVELANATRYGLSGHVYAADADRAREVAGRIRSGTMSVNGGVWYAPDVPFGGVKMSGMGREMGVAGLEEYLEVRSFAEPAEGGDGP